MQYLILLLFAGLICVLYIFFLVATGKKSLSYLFDARNRHLQKRLIRLLYGDAAAAKRLLNQQRRLNPGRSSRWYLEKVVQDLERDRRY